MERERKEEAGQEHGGVVREEREKGAMERRGSEKNPVLRVVNLSVDLVRD